MAGDDNDDSDNGLTLGLFDFSSDEGGFFQLSLTKLILLIGIIFVIVHFRLYKYLDPVHRSVMKEL